jgi:hypothetical protein
VSTRFSAIRWAREAPTLTHRGRVDRLGHHLLLLLSTYARNDGSNVYTSPATLAKEAHASPRELADALGRLEDAKLIRREQTEKGPGWSLDLSVKSEVDTVLEDRAERRRAATRERLRRFRANQKAASNATVERYETHESSVTGNAEVERYVTPESSVTETDVTQEFGVSNAEVDRYKADVTHDCNACNASESVTPAGQTGYNSLELPKEELQKEELQSSGPTDRAAAPADARPAAPRKGTKRTRPADPAKQERERQAQELATGYYEAMNKMVKFMGVKQVVTHALTQFSYDQVRTALERMSTTDRHRPLTRQTLLAAIEAGTGRTGGHQPWRNSTDENAYDGTLI